MRVHAHDWGYSPRRIGHGGSVSRRDLNLLAGNRSQLPWALISKRKVKPIPSHSSGGGPGEALLLEKRPPPAFLSSPHPNIPPSSALRAARMYLETSRG